jgi:hypothetical protein
MTTAATISSGASMPCRNARAQRLAHLFRLWLCVFLCAMATASWANVGSILNILGTAKIQKRTGQVAPAIKGDILYEGDTVWAENASNVQIRMVDGAIVWVRANSELKIEGYKSTDHGSAKDESSLRLLSGSMRTVTGLIGKKNPDNYRLSTPNATIGVRGTEFDAVYVTPAAAAQFHADSGTYNRVYQGSTVLKAGQQGLAVDEGQVAFVGPASGNVPKKLPEIPDFLNLPGNATRATAAPAAEAAPTTAAAPAREQIRISVRYGSTSSRAGEQIVKLDNGAQTRVPLQQLMGNTSLQVGPDRIDSSQLTLAMTASSAGTRQAVVKLQLGEMQASGRPSMGQYKLALDLSPGTWKEVTAQGPWQAAGKGRSGSTTSVEMQKVYIMADEAR